MPAEKKVVSVAFDVSKRIDTQVKTILNKKPITLPDGKHPLVIDYIRKIEGTYDVSRSKEDTDNAIDLLYIAYNTTPKEEGKIRTSIDKLMSRLIEAQQESERKMTGAVNNSGRILKSLRQMFGDWEEARDSKNSQDLKDFIGEDLVGLAEEIKNRAERINGELTKIAKTYDGIIADTTTATNKSELVLAARLQNQSKIKKEINKNNADRSKLESLVDDLKREVNKYEKMANEYKSQAETAENRAFIMSIVRVGAQMVASTIPAITAGITGAATGGASLIAASAASTARQLTNKEKAATSNDNTAKVIEIKKDIANKSTDKATAERTKKELEEKGKKLLDKKKKVKEDEKTDAETKAKTSEAIDKRIEANEAEIKLKKVKIATITTALTALSGTLKSLDENMGKMSAVQENRATNLRAFQMKMLEKIELYEKEKRTQAAELVKINALLKGQKTEEETIQLTIKCLNLNLKALKRVREIIVEISFFFKSFADFMQQIMESAKEQSTMVQNANNFTKRIKRNTNDFFVTQTAEWQAVEVVSAKFVNNFNDGWSKLNKLSGNYLTGDELQSYLDDAAGRIEEISFKRKQASTAKLEELNRYRDLIKAKG